MDRPKLETKADVQFFSSGSSLLDFVLGGGWALKRVFNIVGNRSAGKTQLAIEACANFAQLYGAENIRINETESAFSRNYAMSKLGLPKGVIFVGDEDLGHGSPTVEDFCHDLEDWLRSRDGSPCLYMLDSFDALSDEAELERKIEDGSYRTGKAKMSSEMFRRLISLIDEKNCALGIISQLRDKIGVMFGEKEVRSGGRALDFYSSQIIWLNEMGKIKDKIDGIERVIGIQVRARNKKNKVGRPFRETQFSLLFDYGIDDEISMLEWLKTNKVDESILPDKLNSIKNAVNKARNNRDRAEVNRLREVLFNAVKTKWLDIEEAITPPLSKYE